MPLYSCCSLGLSFCHQVWLGYSCPVFMSTRKLKMLRDSDLTMAILLHTRLRPLLQDLQWPLMQTLLRLVTQSSSSSTNVGRKIARRAQRASAYEVTAAVASAAFQ